MKLLGDNLYWVLFLGAFLLTLAAAEYILERLIPWSVEDKVFERIEAWHRKGAELEWKRS